MAPIDVRRRLEQIRRNKIKNNRANDSANDGKDRRQLIVKKIKTKGGNDRSSPPTIRGRITKQTVGAKSGASMDLRTTNKKLAQRKNAVPQTPNNVISNRNDRPTVRSVQSASRPAPVVNRRVIANGQSIRIGKKAIQQQQYYVPPHMQRAQPTYIIAPAAVPKASPTLDKSQASSTSGVGASVLISNLLPSITQSDIIELFGEIGLMTAVNMINQTTALVSYQNSSDAVRAVKIYHNRLLDGRPMLVNMMPNST